MADVCLGDYFRSLTSNYLTPVYDWQASPLAKDGGWRTVRAEWELLDGPGSLPFRVVYETPGGAAAAVYQVTGATNLGGLIFPTGFTSSRLRAGALPAMSGEAVVTSLRLICSRTNLLPTIAEKVSTHDLRLASPSDDQGAFYLSDHWLSEGEARQATGTLNPPREPPPVVVMPPPVVFPVRSLAKIRAAPNSPYVPFRDALVAADPAAKFPAQGPWTISVEDLKNPMSFTLDLAGQDKGARRRKTPFLTFLWDRLSEGTRSGLAKKSAEMSGRGNHPYQAGEEVSALVADLNRVIQGGTIYSALTFSNIELSGDTLKLLAQKPAGADTARLNRLLLEDALPLDLVPRPKIIADPASKMCALVEFRHFQDPNFTSAIISLYGEDATKLWTADLEPQMREMIQAVPGARSRGGRAGTLNARVSDARFGEKDILVTMLNRNSAGVDLKTGSVRLLPAL